MLSVRVWKSCGRWTFQCLGRSYSSLIFCRARWWDPFRLHKYVVLILLLLNNALGIDGSHLSWLVSLTCLQHAWSQASSTQLLIRVPESIDIFVESAYAHVRCFSGFESLITGRRLTTMALTRNGRFRTFLLVSQAEAVPSRPLLIQSCGLCSSRSKRVLRLSCVYGGFLVAQYLSLSL